MSSKMTDNRIFSLSKEPKAKIQVSPEERARKAGNSNKVIRWNWLWFFLICIVVVPLPLWLYPVHCLAAYVVMSTVTGWSCVYLLCSVITASYTMARMYKAKNGWWKKTIGIHASLEENVSKMLHVVLTTGYKEPLELMIKTLDTIKNQTLAKRVFMLVAFEERTPDFELKANKLRELYKDTVYEILITRHPYGVAGEVAGKCSNANYACRTAMERLKELNLYDPNMITFTTCDSDNLFTPDYLEWLSYDFLLRKDRHEVIWQPPLFYNFELDERPFFVRVTGILRMINMIGMLIPQNINAMSVYSMSWQLLERGDFFHPTYQFVDAIDNLVRMIVIKKTVRLIAMATPVISGPTSGATFAEEVREWTRQLWRWTIGSAEIFHYFCVKWRKFGLLSGIRYALVFTHYYGFVMCGMSLFALIGLISTSAFNAAGVCRPANFLVNEYLMYVPLGGLVFVYVIFAWCFLLDSFASKLLKIYEEVFFLRNVFHWISTPFVLLAYSCIAYFAIAEIAVRGKKVCTHGASKKQVLAADSNPV